MEKGNSLEEEIESSVIDFKVPSDSDAKGENFQWGYLKRIRYQSNTANRSYLAVWTAALVTLWLMGVMWILIKNESTYCLSTPVLLMLLGTTTLNVLGLSYIVLKGYFESISNNEV